MRCPVCGTIAVAESNSCGVCDHLLLSGTRHEEATLAGRSAAIQHATTRGAVVQHATAPLAIERTISGPAASPGNTRPVVSWREPNLTGRVIFIDGPYLEPQDIDFYRVLTRIIWLLLLVGSPVLIVYGVLVTLGGFSAVLALIGVLFLLRYLSPTNLFAIFHLSTMLNPMGRREAEQDPVRFVRVRDREFLDEHIVRIKGHLASGNIMSDDIMSFYGAWRNGVLRVQQAYNHRTNSWIQLRRPHSWIGFIVALGTITLLFLVLYPPAHDLWLTLR